MAERIPVQVQAVLGESVLDAEDILSLSEGSVLMFDRSAKEPIDLIVRSKKIAKGEVIVKNDRYGVRITQIIPPFRRAE